MYFNNGFETLPFSFTITKKTDNSKLALYITIGSCYILFIKENFRKCKIKTTSVI